MSTSDSKIVSKEPLESKDAKWIKLVRTKYTDPTGRTRLWEQVERTTRQKDTDVDAVGIVALLQDKSKTKERGGAGDDQGPLILLEKQFRPALGAPCIEIPAGLIDPGEDVETTAIRELKEETGYVGEVMKPAHPALMGKAGGLSTGGSQGGEGWKWGPVLYNDPGITQTSTLILYLSVDLSNPANQNPSPQLEEGEFIQTFTVPLRNLYAECRRLEEKEGCLIDARVGTLAEGIELSRAFGL